MFGKNTLSEV